MKKLLLLLVVLLALVALVAVSCNQTGEVEPPSADMSDGSVPVEPQAFLTADRTNIQPGECVTLEWGVEGGDFFGVELNGQPVDPSGHQQVCPSETTVYTLAIDVGEAMLCREVPVTPATSTGSGPAIAAIAATTATTSWMFWCTSIHTF